MKKFLQFSLILIPMIAAAQPNYTPVRNPLYVAWEFRQAETTTWLPANVPTSVHSALLQNGKIEDPYYRDNEAKVQWIEEKDWEFRSTFDVDPVTLQKKHVELVFKGLDTYTHIYLNDTLILETDNMFRSWKVDVKKWIKPTGNRLLVYFDSPVKRIKPEWDKLGYELPGGIRTMSRKAQFHFGWDWGPRLAGCGILKAPEIVAWDDVIIENIFVTTINVTPEKAKMVARFRYRSDFAGNVTLISRDGKRKGVEDRKFEVGVHNDSITFEVMNPKLWWSNGMGEPHLYDFSFEIKRGVRQLEKVDVRTGIRTIKLVTEKDKDGESFYFLLNDKRVFAKGANYIPQDLMQDRVTPFHYQKLLDDVKSSNMNMLRVWGGGIYEDDLFYQLCDARGILVWQDFMYACALYPSNGRFLKTAAFEALEQIERLRQHPCIALWCGNNENNEAWNNWGWQMNFTEEQRKQLWRDYKTLFQDLLPIYVETNAGGVSYWESSPRYGRANPKSHKEGDSHYWGVWHDEEPFDVLNKKVPRFMSEFGFQSFPEWKTIETFTLPEDRKLESKVMLAHQKHPRGNALIAEYLQRDYRPVDKFEDLVYVSQLLQAEGMRTGIEAHRRNKPYCMGTLYWQLNDVWGGASWASRDYFGRWKALQYYVREAYKPVAVLPYVENDVLKVYGVSDLPDSAVVHLRVRAMTLDGKVFNEVNLPDTLLLADSSKVLWEMPLKKFLEKHKPENTMIECQLLAADSTVLSHRLLFVTVPKNLKLSNPRIKTTVSKQPLGYEITLTCENLAKNVFLQSSADGFFSDNYFDLIPGESKTVLFTTKADLKEASGAFTVKHLLDTWK